MLLVVLKHRVSHPQSSDCHLISADKLSLLFLLAQSRFFIGLHILQVQISCMLILALKHSPLATHKAPPGDLSLYVFLKILNIISLLHSLNHQFHPLNFFDNFSLNMRLKTLSNGNCFYGDCYCTTVF